MFPNGRSPRRDVQKRRDGQRFQHLEHHHDFDGVEYGGSGYTTVEATDYTVQIRGDTETDDGEVVADFDVSPNGGTVYTAFAAGYLSPDDEPEDTGFDLFVAQDSSN